LGEELKALVDLDPGFEAERPAELYGFIKFQEGARERLQRAKRFGVRMAAGSDMAFIWPGKTRGQASLRMFEAYRLSGLAPLEIIRMATVNASELLGWEDRVGTIEAGKYADFVAMDGDPLQDLGELQRVTFVMKSGAVVDLRDRGKVLHEASKTRG